MKACLLIPALFLCILAGAQTFRDTSPEESAAVLAKVDAALSFRGRLTADFVQTRHSSLLAEDMVSRGKMTLNAPEILVWEYSAPSQKRSEVKLAGNARYAAMSRKGDFSRTVLGGNGEWKICLKPLKRDLKQLFSSIEVWMDAASGEYSKVILTETSGDSTTLEFSNVRRYAER